MLGRSTESVKHKAQKLGLNIYVNEFIYARTLARCFNQDIRVVFRWIEKLGLPARKRRVANALRYLIDVENFWKWAETHKEDINWSRYELMSLPPEPAWVREEKRNYAAPKTRTKITRDEVLQVRNLLHRGMSFPEISLAMGRTTDSVKHIARKNGL